SPISAITAAASLLSSRVTGSTSANSHSTPMVGRGDPAKSILAGLVTAVALLSGYDTARHPLAGVTGGHRRLVGAGRAVDLLVALRRDVAEVVGLLVDDDGRLLACEQVRRGERIGGGDQHRRPVP